MKKRVRKPRDIPGMLRVSTLDAPVSYFELSISGRTACMPIGYAKRLHAWLAKYIAWAEQEKERCK